MGKSRGFMYQLRNASSLMFSVVLLLLCPACGGGGSNSGNNGTSQIAPTLAFSVTPKVAAPGQTVNFSWTTTNATAFTVTPSILGSLSSLPLNAATYSVTAPAATATYAATATGPVNPPATSSATITIVPVLLSANNGSVTSGQPVTLMYTGPDNGSTFTLTAQPGNTTTSLTGAACDGTKCTGTYTTNALSASTTFQVTATGPVGGTSLSTQVVVTVNTPPTLTFSLSPTVAASGQTVNFAWATTNATTFTVTPNILGEDQNVLPLNSTLYPVGAPGSTTTYLGTATGTVDPRATASAVVTVIPMTLSADRTQISAGQTVTLTYSGPSNGSTYTLTALPANNVTTLTGASCDAVRCNGTYTTNPLSSNTTYQVTATGPVGGTSSSPQVAITVVGQMTVTLTANPTTVNSGGQSTLTWTTSNAQSISIDQGIGPVTPVSNGSVTVHPTQTTTYTATATDVFGNTQTATATVTVSTGGITNLNHIIYMLQENRSFDNYFGKLGAYRARRRFKAHNLAMLTISIPRQPNISSRILRARVTALSTRARSVPRT